MPWLLLALVGVAGGLYYETNKARPGFQRWQLTFPPALEGDALRTAVLNLAQTLGGQVVKIKSPGVYIVDMPKAVEPTLFNTPLAVPGVVKVAGREDLSRSRVGSGMNSLMQEDDRLAPQDDESTYVTIGGARWNGSRFL